MLRPGAKEPHYGVIELAARTEIDKSADLVTLSNVRITKSSFPGASAEDAEKYLAALRGAVTRTRGLCPRRLCRPTWRSCRRARSKRGSR